MTKNGPLQADLVYIGYHAFLIRKVKKLDGVGPVDNKPSTNKLNQFVFFFRIYVTHDK